jgi:thiamine pyrophosphate-dependent acetolactate synthase large subunit-like protein
VRDFTKWDDQPASVPAALESILRANSLARTGPRGPVYICLDVDLQEKALDSAVTFPDVARFQPPRAAAPAKDAVLEAAAMLSAAERPMILAGRVSRGDEAWRERVALAERMESPVLTDLKLAAAFPTKHPLHVAPPTFAVDGDAASMLAEADVILSLDWLDLAGTLKLAGVSIDKTRIIHCSFDAYAHKAPGADHQGLPPVDISIPCHPDVLVSDLMDALDRIGGTPRQQVWWKPGQDAADVRVGLHGAITQFDMAEALDRVRGDRELCFTQVSLGWPAATCDFRSPLDFLGRDGGAGVGSGPGIAVGVALALADSDRIPVAIVGDGDFAMGANAIWTAVHYQLPLVVLIANNRSYMNDERHQQRVAKTRNRPVDNKWIGQRMEDPIIDHAGMARAQGAEGLGPITEHDDLEVAIDRALDVAERGGVAVVDIHVIQD